MEVVKIGVLVKIFFILYDLYKLCVGEHGQDTHT